MRNHAAFRCLAVATLAFTFAYTPTGAAQEQEQQTSLGRVFVSDKLVLNVYAEPGQSGERVGTIETGDAVDEIERADDFVHVRLADGREGWVGANYLSTDPPAATRLRELQREQKAGAPDKKSTDEIARLQKQVAALQKELADAKTSSVAAAHAEPEGAAPPLQDLEPFAEQERRAAPPIETTSSGRVWLWPFIVVLAISVGYTAGYQTLASRIRKKFGGLKIY